MDVVYKRPNKTLNSYNLTISSSMSKTQVAIVGASGETGKSILNGLEADGSFVSSLFH